MQTMRTEPAITTIFVSASYDKTLHRIREALRGEGLTAVMEFDLSERITRVFGTEGPSCRVLFIDSPLILLEAMANGIAAATMFPLHVAVSERNSGTLVQFLSPIAIQESELSIGSKISLGKLQNQISRSLDAIGAHEALAG
jgi:uncharacterized protein (DUF302 family)